MANIENEKIVVARMIRLYCRAHHGAVLCDECRALIEYTDYRLTNCRYGAAKRSCKTCPIHCYAPQKREEIRVIMREIGPRMLFYMPLRTLKHLIGR